MDKPLQLYKAVGCRDASEVQRSFEKTAWWGLSLAPAFSINAGGRNHPTCQNATLKHLAHNLDVFQDIWNTLSKWSQGKVPGLLTCKPKVIPRKHTLWAPDNKQSTRHAYWISSWCPQVILEVPQRHSLSVGKSVTLHHLPGLCHQDSIDPCNWICSLFGLAS